MKQINKIINDKLSQKMKTGTWDSLNMWKCGRAVPGKKQVRNGMKKVRVKKMFKNVSVFYWGIACRWCVRSRPKWGAQRSFMFGRLYTTIVQPQPLKLRIFSTRGYFKPFLSKFFVLYWNHVRQTQNKGHTRAGDILEGGRDGSCCHHIIQLFLHSNHPRINPKRRQESR